MDFLNDISTQDPLVIVCDITSNNDYVLSVKGSINATSISQNGTDINNIFLKLNNSSNNITACNLYTSNIYNSNTFSNLGIAYFNNDTIINGILCTSNDIITTSKIKENNIYLSNIYVSSNVLNNYLLYYSTISSTDSQILGVSNYTFSVSNSLKSNIDANLIATSNYTFNASNYLIGIINTNDSNASNYTSNTSNYLIGIINTNNSNASNYTSNTSNYLIGIINTNNSNASNYTSNASNYLIGIINTNNSNASNYTTNVSNVLATNIGSKQNTILASTPLSCVGSNITNIDYNNISSANKPDLTLYNAWTKNTNDIYTSIAAGNVAIGTSSTTQYKLNVAGSLNMTSLYLSGTQINFGSYQPALTFTLPLSVSGNTVSINLSSYSTTGSDTNYLKINGTNSMAANAGITLSGTGTFTGIHSGNGAGITNIDYNNISAANKPDVYNKTEINTKIDSSSNYTTNVSNVLATNIGSKQNTILTSTPLSCVGSNITNINYNNISTNKPNITSITINMETRPYPPVYFTDPVTTYTTPNASNTVNSTLYGRGTYVATPGSVFSSGTAPNITYQHLYYIYGGAPSLNPSFSQWTSSFGIFNSSGAYTGLIKTTINSTPISGETATLKFPYLVVITSYSLTSSSAPYHNYMMKDWVLCGSIDGINYTQLHSPTNVVWGASDTRVYSFANSTEYLFYRIVIKSTNTAAINSGTYSATVCCGIVFYGYEIKNGQSTGALGIGTTATGTSATDNASLLVYGTTKLVGNTYINNGGRLGLGTTTPTELLHVNGNIKCVGEIKNQYWRFSNDPDYCRLYNIGVNTYFNFAAANLYADTTVNVNGGIIYINAAIQGVSGSRGIFFRSGYADYNCSILTYDHSGDGFPDGLSINSYDGISFCTGANSRSERMRINQSGYVGINNTSPNCHLSVAGIANIHNGSPVAVNSSFMQSGSLTIGGTNANYGGSSGWSSNTAGLLFECLDTTEIVIHDSGHRLVSFMYYSGGNGPGIYLGRDMGWGATPVYVSSYLYITGSSTTNPNVNASPGNGSLAYSGSGLFIWGGYNNSTVVVQNCTVNMAIGIYCFNGISAKSFISISDIRIKKNIKSIVNVSNIINNLNPVQYDYIEYNKSSTGFIAQEVYDVYPSAVNISIEHIPNIMEPATINGNIVTFENKCNIIVNANNSIRICHDSNYNNGFEYIITKVIDKNTFVINKNDFKSNDIYLYGMLVGDFMSVDYNQVIALNTSAIQDLYNIIKLQQRQIDKLTNILISSNIISPF